MKKLYYAAVTTPIGSVATYVSSKKKASEWTRQKLTAERGRGLKKGHYCVVVANANDAAEYCQVKKWDI